MDCGIVTLSTDQQGEVLQAFSKALQREVHNLTPHPDILWQQLYNRLQWEEGPTAELATAELEKSGKLGRNPWIRARTPFRESKELIHSLTGSMKDVNACTFSPDGQRIVSVGWDGTLIVWDATSGRELQILPELMGHVQTCAFSPDGKWIVSAGYDDTLKIWEVDNGQNLGELIGHTNEVKACAFSPDGKWIASAISDGFKLWDMASGEELRSLKTTGKFSFSPDGQMIVSSNDDHALVVWDLVTGHELRTLTGHTNVVNACAFSPDGHMIVSASTDKTIKIWDAVSGSELLTLTGHTGEIFSCTFSPDGQRIISASDDATIKIWDISFAGNPGVSYACKKNTPTVGHKWEIKACSFSPDGNWIISASKDATLNIWDSISGRLLHTLTGDTERVQAYSFSPDGQKIVFPYDDATLKVWDANSGSDLLTLTWQSGSIYACGFSSDGQWIVSESYFYRRDDKLKIWDATNGRELYTFTGQTHGFVSMNNHKLAFSPDDQRILSAIGDYDETLKIWGVTSGRELNILTRYKGGVNTSAVSPGGRWVVSPSYDKTLKIWDMTSRRELWSVAENKSSYNSYSFSPDGQWIVSACGYHKNLKVWEVGIDLELYTLNGHTDYVITGTFSPDGQWIVSASYDKTLKIWEMSSGRERCCIPLLGKITAVALHPWKPIAFCGDSGGNVYLLYLDGIKYGPIIVTAKMGRKGLFKSLIIRCPACREEHPIKEEQLGSEMTCPTFGCGLRLKINPFTIEMK